MPVTVDEFSLASALFVLHGLGSLSTAKLHSARWTWLCVHSQRLMVEL